MDDIVTTKTLDMTSYYRAKADQIKKTTTTILSNLIHFHIQFPNYIQMCCVTNCFFCPSYNVYNEY